MLGEGLKVNCDVGLPDIRANAVKGNKDNFVKLDSPIPDLPLRARRRRSHCLLYESSASPVSSHVLKLTNLDEPPEVHRNARTELNASHGRTCRCTERPVQVFITRPLSEPVSKFI